jgi:hypothetical protein
LIAESKSAWKNLKKQLSAKIFRISEQKLRNYHTDFLSPTHFESRKFNKTTKKAVLSTKKYAFDNLKKQRILRVDRAFELKAVKLFQSLSYLFFDF